MMEEKERDLVEEIAKDKKKHIRNKWLPYTFGPEALKLVPYDVNPVTDIPIRLAVERGVIPRKRDLTLYRTTEDWNGHPKNSIVIAGPLEEGQPFAVWIGDDSYVAPEPGTEVAIPRKVVEKPVIEPVILTQTRSKEIGRHEVARLALPVRKLFGSILATKHERAFSTRRLAALFQTMRSLVCTQKPRTKPRRSFLALR
jgi:hypothetical protein